jgi:hypothetical protein
MVMVAHFRAGIYSLIVGVGIATATPTYDLMI